VAGRNFTAQDANRGKNICYVGNKIANKYFESARKAISKKLRVNDKPYQIIGVLEETGSTFVDRTDNQVFIPIHAARQHFALTDKSFMLSVKVKDIKQLNLAQDAAIGQMRIIKKLKLNEAENFSLISSESLANMLLDNIRIITITAAAIGFITLLGAAIGLMNIMLVAVAERTREIGVSKAIGADNETIKRQFLYEAIFISLKGGILGMFLGILSGNLFSIFFDSPFIIPWKWVFLGLGTCFLVGLLSGVYPAIKASRLNPINALRYE
jgi:putative ABC transport system permease protein